jgi:hypothetical protein
MASDGESGVRSPTRLAAVERSGLVGIAPEDRFDRLIELAVEFDWRAAGSHRTGRLGAHYRDEYFPKGWPCSPPSICHSSALSSAQADHSSLRPRSGILGHLEVSRLKHSVLCRGLAIPSKMLTAWFLGHSVSWTRAPTNGLRRIYRFLIDDPSYLAERVLVFRLDNFR